jgi:hypothetical protein
MRTPRLVAAALLAISVSGCATILEGTTQKISVTTPPASGAACVLTNERGSWTLTSPGSVEVKRSTTDLVITCKKEGWADATGTLHSRTSNGTTASAFLWGPIGVGVDAASGASFLYPTLMNLPMTALPPAAPTGTPAPAEAPAPAK